MPNRLRPTIYVSSVTILLALSAGINVLQAQRIRSLNAANIPVSPAIGQAAPPIQGFALDGQPQDISLRAGVPTVVYFFSPTCSWCERNWANVEALRNQAAGRYRVIAVSKTRDLRAYVGAHGLGIDVVEGISDNTRQSFGFSGTPHTVVVSSDNVITHDWRGAFTARIERQIEELFEIRLPGVLPNPTDTPNPGSR